MKNQTTTQFLTRTALMLALAIIFQNFRLFMGSWPYSTIVIGSLVNLCLVVALGRVGLASAIVVSIITPLVALMQGHLPHPFFAPVTMVGNISIVTVLYIFIKFNLFNKISDFAGVILGAVLKWGLLYWLGVIWVLNTLIPEGTLKPAQVKAISANFNIPQLVTALIGGILGVIVIKMINKGMKSKIS